MTKGAVRGFIAVTLAFVIMGIILGQDIKKNSRSIKQLRVTKANVSQLQRSNCTIRIALLKARRETYDKVIKAGKTQKQAIAATNNLTIIIVGMDGERYCPTPNKYKLRQER